MKKTREDSTLSVLVKTTEACPLACIYCYEGDKSNKTMNDSTLQAMVNSLETRSDKKTSTHYIWHGAEPLSAGINFFKKVIEIQEPFRDKGNIITNGIQSNGVLLTEEYVKFLVSNKFRIGISLDGPKEIQDISRPYKNGASSFDKTREAIEILRKAGNPVSVISVLTQKSIDHIDEIFQFFNDEDITFCLNPFMKCGYGKNSYQDLYLKKGDYARVIIDLFERTLMQEKNVFSNFDKLVESLTTGKSTSCENTYSCQYHYIGIDTEGYVLPCSRFTKEELNFGNIHSDDISDILNHPKRKEIQHRYESLEECTSCEYGTLCYSGCPHNAFTQGDITQKDPNCSDKKRIYREVSGLIFEQIKDAV
jgi:uncharacterized protein